MNKLIFLLPVVFLPSVLQAQSSDSLAIAKKVDSLLDVAFDYIYKDSYDTALVFIAKAEKCAEDRFGQESAKYAKACLYHGLSLFYSGVFHYQEAEVWILKTKTIQEKVLPRDHPSYARTIHHLAKLYLWWDKYDLAEGYFNQELSIWKRTKGTENPDYAGALTMMAQMYYYNIGNYAKAEALYLEAKGILERTVGKMDNDYGATVEGLADLYDVMGEHEKSEAYYEEYLSILEHNEGKENLSYAHCLNNFAELYKDMGNLKKAKMLVLESKSIRDKLVGKESYEYGSSLNNVAEVEYELGNYKEAEKLLLESLPVMERQLGKEHADYAWGELDLAKVYKKLKNYDSAESLFLHVLGIYDKTYGKHHHSYLSVLPYLAGVYYKKGKTAEAERVYLEYLSSWEELLGKENSGYLSALKNLSELYWKAGKWEDARRYMLEANDIEKKLLLKASKHLSEQELEMFIKEYSSGQNRVLSFARLKKGGEADVCYDDIVFYKGFMLNAVVQKGKLAGRDSTAAALFRQLKTLENRLSVEYAKPIDKRIEVPEMEEKVNGLEKELARKVAGFGDDSRQVTWKDVQASLKPGEAAIEFVRYRFKNPKSTDTILYAAILLLPSLPSPIFISLCDEKALGTLLESKGALRADYVNDLYSYASRGINPVDAARKSLAELIWMPIQKELDIALGSGKLTRIYYAPSGLLHRLNLGAIAIAPQEEDGGTLADKFNLVQLKSTRQLAVPETHEYLNNEAVLYGGVEFDPDSSLFQNNTLAYTETNATRGQATPDSSYWLAARGLENIGSSWNYLPGTEREVNALEKILIQAGVQTTLTKSHSATEESFKTIGSGARPSPRILHLATHGYFFPDAKDNSSEKDDEDQASVFESAENPMLRSGLLLAGANAAWSSGQAPKPGMEDGILTAYEISQLNLSNTELVVLSACETGLGDIHGNEGVYGLQRAFKIAGVKYLIMSLWQVPDKQTGELMKAFYQKWLVEKMSVPEAFHAAQQAMRERFVDPYVWAGFVLME